MKKIVFLTLLLTLTLASAFGQPMPDKWPSEPTGCLYENPKIAYPKNEAKALSPAPYLSIPVTIDHSDYCPPAGDQGVQGACIPFAFSYVKSWQEAVAIGWIFANHSAAENLAHTFSAAYMYNLLHKHGTPGGLNVGPAILFSIGAGGMTLNRFPYNQYDDSTQPGPNLRYLGMNFRMADGWLWSYNLAIVHSWLVLSPVITIITNPSGSNHCVCIVGYNDTINLGNGKIGGFKYENSAGPNWGDNGFGWLAYADISADQPFYYIADRPNHLPEQMYDFQTSFQSEGMGEPREIVRVHFLSGNDTLKTIQIQPFMDDYYLAIDTAVAANKIAINADQWYREDTAAFNYRLKFYNGHRYNLPDSTMVPMDFDTTESLAVVYENYSYIHYDSLLVQLRIPAVGLNEIKPTQTDVSAYPNPFRGQINFAFSQADENKSVQIQIYDLNSKIVSETISQVAGEIIKLNLDTPPGLYLAKLTIGSRTQAIKIMAQ